MSPWFRAEAGAAVNAARGRTAPLFVDAELAPAAKSGSRTSASTIFGMSFGSTPGAPVASSTAATANGARSRPIAKQAARLPSSSSRGQQSAAPDLWLVFAPIKRARIDLRGREGDRARGGRLLPVDHAAHRCRAREHRAAARDRDRSGRTMRTAERARGQAARYLGETVGRMAATRRGLLLCAEGGAVQPIAEALPHTRRIPPRSWAIIDRPRGRLLRVRSLTPS